MKFRNFHPGILQGVPKTCRWRTRDGEHDLRMRPPGQKPRQMHRNLTKSVQCTHPSSIHWSEFLVWSGLSCANCWKHDRFCSKMPIEDLWRVSFSPTWWVPLFPVMHYDVICAILDWCAQIHCDNVEFRMVGHYSFGLLHANFDQSKVWSKSTYLTKLKDTSRIFSLSHAFHVLKVFMRGQSTAQDI